MVPAGIMAALATCLLVVVEILFQTKGKATLQAIWVWELLPFALVFMAGNVVLAAVVVPLVLETTFPDVYWSLSWLQLYVLSAFIGIFGFEGLLSNTNISFFNKGLLAFQDWLDKARQPAVEAAITKQDRMYADLQEQT